jgi:oligoribonuclease NrnB/cAMP/cGMP phosphodiesterase (DHH superfamily)
MDKNTLKHLIIYHNDCSDGFTSAAIAYKSLLRSVPVSQIQQVPGVYGEAPPDTTNAVVYLVDFSYSLDTVKDMLKVAHSVYFIDHHITAFNNLKEIINNPEQYPNFYNHWSNANSGAMLTWMHFNGCKPAPDLVAYVEDRDLWTWKLPYTNEYLMALELYDFTLDTYITHLNKSMYQIKKQHTKDLINQGTVVFKYYQKLVENICTSAYFVDYCDFKNVPIVNCTSRFSSHVGNQLAKNNPLLFSIMYQIHGDDVHLSFRSVDTGVDVSEIAKSLGGGGHRNASGAKISLQLFTNLFKLAKGSLND